MKIPNLMIFLSLLALSFSSNAFLVSCNKNNSHAYVFTEYHQNGIGVLTPTQAILNNNNVLCKGNKLISNEKILTESEKGKMWYETTTGNVAPINKDALFADLGKNIYIVNELNNE